MTALRNCMNIITLDCLMQIASNCPKIDHLDGTMDPVIMSICFEAFDHWASVMQRFPGRAHGHQGRKKKGSPGSLSDFYEDLSKTARAAGGGGRLIESSDEEDGDSEAHGAEQDADADNEMGGVTGVGDYEVKAGWHVLNEPASTPEL